MALDLSRKPRGFNTPTRAAEYDAVNALLKDRVVSVCRHLLPAGKLINGEYTVGDLDNNPGKTLKINVRKGIWKDFNTGEWGADLIALWADAKGIKMHEAKEEAERWLGVGTGRQARSGADTPSPTTAGNGVHPKPSILVSTPNQPLDDDPQWWRKVQHTAKWDYVLADGEVFGTVYRFDDPTGRHKKELRPWDHRLRDWKAPEGLRPLYNLPGLTGAGPVILVEGEKCADALIALGYMATTIWGGAAAAGKTDWSPLRGRDVVRWADNDHKRADGHPTGREVWERTTLKHLQEAGAASVRDVAIPDGQDDGWDAADAEPEERRFLVEEARAAPPVHEGVREVDILECTADRLFTGPAPERRWLIENVLPLGIAGVLAAQGDAGKSLIALDLAFKVAAPRGPGKDMNPPLALGFPVIERGAVAVLLAEDDAAEVHRRLESIDPDGALRAGPGQRVHIVTYANHGGAPNLTDELGRITPEYQKIRASLARIPDLRLIVFDPLTPFIPADMNKPEIGGAVSKMLAQLATETGATTLMLHHLVKGDNKRPITTVGEARNAIRGTGALVDGMRFAYAFWPVEEGESRRLLESLGRKYEANASYKGAVVKSNAPAARDQATYVRRPGTGLLDRVPEDTLAAVRNKPVEVAPDVEAAILRCVETWSKQGNPTRLADWHMSAGVGSLHGLLPKPLADFKGTRLQAQILAMVEAGKLSRATGKGTTGTGFIDLPDGPYSKGSDAPGGLRASERVSGARKRVA